jgi:hypothetical protein
MVPDFRRDDVWIPVFTGMTDKDRAFFKALKCYNNLSSSPTVVHSSIIPFFYPSIIPLFSTPYSLYPTPFYFLVELRGIKLGTSRCGTTESIPTRFRPLSVKTTVLPITPQPHRNDFTLPKRSFCFCSFSLYIESCFLNLCQLIQQINFTIGKVIIS